MTAIDNSNVPRENSLDFLRGLAALSVIQIHTVFGSGVGYVPEWMRQISLMFDVPVFFFLAGWAQSFKPVSPKLLPGLLRLYVDYLLYSFAIVLFCLALGSGSLYDLVRVITLQGFKSENVPVVGVSLWFVKVYLGCMLVFCLSGILLQSRDVRMRVCASLALMIIVGSFLAFRQQAYIYYYLGFLVAGWIFAKTGFNARSLVVLAVLLMMLLVIHQQLVPEKSLHERLFVFSKFPPDAFYLMMSLPSIGICMFAYHLKWKNRGVEWVGRNALWVYFAQGISASILYLIVPGNLPEAGWVPVWAAMLVVNVVLALVISIVLRRAITPMRDAMIGILQKLAKNLDFGFFQSVKR